MFKWLGKIKWHKRRPTGPEVIDFGQYVFKPVIARAISVVVGVSQAQLCEWIAHPEIDIFLNDEPLQGARWARRRLEAGQYEIRIPSQNKVWRFFIA